MRREELSEAGQEKRPAVRMSRKTCLSAPDFSTRLKASPIDSIAQARTRLLVSSRSEAELDCGPAGKVRAPTASSNGGHRAQVLSGTQAITPSRPAAAHSGSAETRKIR